MQVTSTGAGFQDTQIVARLDELERKFGETPHRYFASLANEYRKAGEPERAAEMCRTQLAAIPGHISGHIVLGQALYDSGDFEESRTALERALALDPENIVALRYLGDIARDTGDVPGAERWYTRTLEADPYNEAATAALQVIREKARLDQPQVADYTETVTDSAPAPAVVAVVEDTVDLVPVAQTEAAAEPATDVTVEEVLEAGPAAPTEEIREPEPVAAAEEQAPPESEQELTPEAVSHSADFAGDLEISAASEPAESIEAPQLQSPEDAKPETAESGSDPVAGGIVEQSSAEQSDQPLAQEVPVADTSAAEEPAVEPVDVVAHPLPEPVTLEELIRAEERVMESAAPFVTETMADLYLEQGYPHEALELLLQLSEQRPDDAQLRDKIESIKSIIAARRDAAVAAARAQRAEAAETSEMAGAAAALESTTLEAEPLVEEPAPAPEPPATPPAPRSVRELFARMDSARPRGSAAATPRAPARLRSDFVPLPDPRDAQMQPADDPFGFPDAQPPAPPPAPAQHQSTLPRTSGPHPTFDPSTAEPDDFDAWLRGLRGP